MNKEMSRLSGLSVLQPEVGRAPDPVMDRNE